MLQVTRMSVTASGCGFLSSGALKDNAADVVEVRGVWHGVDARLDARLDERLSDLDDLSSCLLHINLRQTPCTDNLIEIVNPRS